MLATRRTEAELRDYLATFGFCGERVFEAIAPFSGGEKARLVLALVAFQRPNLLLLDEPTNHLDLEMRQALAVALQDYPGAVVLVSHDRHLLNTVADEFIVVHHGRAEAFDGDLDDYARWLADGAAASPLAVAAAAVPAPLPATAAPPASESAEQRRQRRRDEAGQRARLTPLRQAIQNYEQQLAELGRERMHLEASLADPGIYQPGAQARLQAALARQAELAALTERAEAGWLEASAQLEQAQQAGQP
jgi:ATP-binding cassette subfamily F protein 3